MRYRCNIAVCLNCSRHKHLFMWPYLILLEDLGGISFLSKAPVVSEQDGRSVVNVLWCTALVCGSCGAVPAARTNRKYLLSKGVMTDLWLQGSYRLGACIEGHFLKAGRSGKEGLRAQSDSLMLDFQQGERSGVLVQKALGKGAKSHHEHFSWWSFVGLWE